MPAKINLPLSPEVMDNRRLLGDGSNLHGKVDSVKTKTDALPADTSGELSAIKTFAQNAADDAADAVTALSGITSTDIPSIQGKLDAHSTSLGGLSSDVSAIKAKTDALPADTGAALTSIETKVDIIDSLVDSVKAMTDNLPVNTSTALSAIEGKIDTVDTVVDGHTTSLATITSNLAVVDNVVDGIQSDLDNPTDGLGALKVLIDSVQATATAIQNNTRLTSSIPQEIQVPASGTVYTKFFINMYDSGGNKEDPDNNDVAIILTNVSGTDITTARLYKDGSGTALDNSTEFPGSKKMERDSLGRYFIFYKNTSTDTVDTLNFQLKYNESTVLNGSDRSMRVVEQLGSGAATVANQTQILSDLAVVDGNVDAIKAVTDLLPDAGALTSIAKASDLATVDTVVDSIKAVTDLLPNGGALTSLATASALSTVDGKIDVVDSNVDSIKTTVESLKTHATLFDAAKATAGIVQGGNSVLTIGSSDGFNCYNAEILRLTVAATGASTNFTVQIYAKSDSTFKLLELQECDAATGVDILFPSLPYINKDATATKAIYVKITNVADVGSTLFNVSLRGKVCDDAVA